MQLGLVAQVSRAERSVNTPEFFFFLLVSSTSSSTGSDIVLHLLVGYRVILSCGKTGRLL